MRKLLLFTFLMVMGLGVQAQNAIKEFAKDLKDGIASYYHDKFEGRLTANGEIFDQEKFTAASNTLKLGTYVKVTNLSNGEICYVKINDRMARTNTRLIDLAHIAARKLDFIRKGITKVKVEVVSADEGKKGILAQVAAEKAGSNSL